mgnify:CR=1 FL=1
MKQLILTVQACEKVTEKCKVKYRLGISFQDSIEIFKVRKLRVILIFEDIEIITKTICGPPLKKGFDLYHKDLDAWIKKNNFCNYEKGKPTKLMFEIVKNVQETQIELKFSEKK